MPRGLHARLCRTFLVCLITISFKNDFALIVQFKQEVYRAYLNYWLYLICFSVTTGHFACVYSARKHHFPL